MARSYCFIKTLFFLIDRLLIVRLLCGYCVVIVWLLCGTDEKTTVKITHKQADVIKTSGIFNR